MTPVKEIATTNSARRRNRTKPAGSAKTLDLILWVGIGMVCAILFGFMIFSSSDLFIKRHELSNAALVSDASQPKGMVDIAACLANPAENEKLACRYLGLLPQLDSPDFRDKLAAVLKAEAEYVLLPSLALCMLDDARGMPGIISLLEEEEPDSASFEILEANLFSDHFAALNPLHNDYQRASDIQFLINVVEISLPHTFPGSNTSQKREHILEWWREHADETMLEWQIAFLKSDSELNRSTAFQKLSRKAWKEKDLLPHLVRTMKNETNTSLKNHMTVELFKMGVPAALNAFDEYVTNASHPDDIANILAIVSLKVDLPNKFKLIDQWNGGCRNDDASFDFFSNWWVENRQFLTYYRQRWRVRKPGQKHPSGSEPSAENELAKDPRKQFME